MTAEDYRLLNGKLSLVNLLLRGGALESCRSQKKELDILAKKCRMKCVKMPKGEYKLMRIYVTT